MPSSIPQPHHKPSRLRTARRPSLLGIAAMLACCAALAQTQARVKTQADLPPPVPATPAQVPGYYRQAIGALTVTALFDGVVHLPRQQLLGVPPARIDALVRTRFVPEAAQGFQTAVNAYLIEREGELVLVDTGTAGCFGAGLGNIPANLRAAGHQPEQVRHVLLTHGHPDHICGLLDADGGMAYPNATVWLDAVELQHWQSDASKARFPKAMQFIFDQARAALAPYQAAGQLRAFSAGDALPAGADSVATPGHTPGHTAFLFGADGPQPLLVWGDVLHYHAVQFAEPAASFEADEDRAKAIASRRAMLALAHTRQWWVAGAHLPYPGLGHVGVAGADADSAYAWVPAEFSPFTAPSPR